MIRSLMERATIYRAVSVPAAFWGGGLSLAAFLGHLALERNHQAVGAAGFLALWLGVLALAVAGNAVLLLKEARHAGTRFPHPSFKMAFRGLFPAFLIAAVFTAMGQWQAPATQAAIWILFYGLGLLGTWHFAPRSLILLGWLFVGSALAWFFWAKCHVPYPSDDAALTGSGLMALTFGGYHLIYAAAVRALSASSRFTSSE